MYFTATRLTVVTLWMCAVGCGTSSPSKAFDELAAAAEKGDEAAFLAGFSTESRPLMTTLVKLKGHNKAATRLGFDTRVRAIAEKIQADGLLAIVVVETDGDNPQRGQVFMKKEGRAWKLDLTSTELLWNRQWELSGGKPRAFPDWFETGVPSLDNPDAIR